MKRFLYVHKSSFQMTTSLSINKVSLQVRLGVTDDERAGLQDIEISITLYYPEIPAECTYDDTESYICYDGIVKKVEAFIKHREFKLLEYLGYQIFGIIRERIPPHIKLTVSTTKLSPPVPAIKDGCTFTCSDV